MRPKHIKVFAPATIANVGPGFDVLGIAIEQPGDIIIAERKPESDLSFSLHQPAADVPTGSNNVAAHVAQLMLDEFKPSFGVTMSLQKNMPLSSGLGSSGASSAAAAVAINALLEKPLAKKDLIRFAVEGERLASGSPHADNVAPSILGGVCLVRSYTPLDIIQLPFKNSLFWVVAHPQLTIHTKTARDLMPKTIPLATVIEQNGNLGALITGLSLGDHHIIAASLKDVIAEPIRAPLIPGFYDIKTAALEAGAIGFSISGSGPSVFAIATSLPLANQVAERIKQAFFQYAHVECETYISLINQEGAKVMEEIS